jgi:xanthosine utilization system XapX-like protein
MRVSFWWRDTARLYVRYLIALGASIPVAIWYAYLAMEKLDTWWSTIALVGIGLGAATIGWRVTERLFVSNRQPFSAEVANEAAYGLGLRFSAVMAVSIVVLCNAPPKQLLPAEKTLMHGDTQALSTSATQASADASL